jgi:predicted glycosyltransferase involved in capsule biosynthesis
VQAIHSAEFTRFSVDTFICWLTVYRIKNLLTYEKRLNVERFAEEFSKKIINMQPFDFSLEIIIPVCARIEYDVAERIKWRGNYNLPTNCTFTIVDYGSSPEEAQKIKSACELLQFKYIHVPSRNGIWNASKARNMALIESSSDYVLFEDVDLVSHRDFYKWLVVQVESLIRKQHWPFLVVPVAYLSEAGSDIAKDEINDVVYADLTSELYNHSSEKISFHAPASSFLVCSRKDAMAVGGYDESFEGWGYEDSDFWLRLLRKANIEKPRDFYRLDTRNYRDQVQWRGWRALFRVFADLLANKGVYAFHVWHPIAPHRSDSVKERNRSIFLNNSKAYSSNKYCLTPLRSPYKPADLFLTKNPHSFNDALFEVFDNPLFIDEDTLDPRNVDVVLRTYSVRRVIFNNPYGKDKRRALYTILKSMGVPCFVVERGALPWSIYIDEGGFCAESSSYSEENWVHMPFGDKERAEAQNYVNDLRITGASLEPQADLIGGRNLKRNLFGDNENLKILFVPFQSPSDTTTNFFCGDCGSFDRFVHEVKLLPHLLPSNWKVVYKNHPLTIDKLDIEGAFNADSCHVGDILEMADAVCLINSGVGVLAAAYNKPVYYFGQAFYACNGINYKVTSGAHLIEQLMHPEPFDIDKSLKFLYFLVFRFYSFAKWDHKVRKHTDKAKLSISENIVYEVVRVKGFQEHRLPPSLEINLRDSMLFDRYRLDDYLDRTSKGSSPAQLKKIELDSQASKVGKPFNDKKFGTKFTRKFKKFVRTPKLFFADAIAKRV